jgi:RimJ/RimL family protein N-acetyltransferase
MYQYPFLQLGCQMVVNRIAADNERLLAQCARLNYSFIPIPRMLGRRRDGVLGQLTREAWEANKFNQRYQHHLDAPPREEAA